MRRRTLTAMVDALASAKPGKLLHVTVLHDDECTASRCVCGGTDVRVEAGTAENIARGAAATRRWIKETSS